MKEGEILRKESSCFNHLRWRIFVEQKIPYQDFIATLTVIGYHEKIHPLFPKIVEMEHKQGHRILFVPKTNRIQLKLSIDSSEEVRVEQASQIAKNIVAQFNLQ